ncbi:MAG: hypothetical protein U0984_17875 [Prosthecobacter sp.]|nr:hypothetical protein [Prosthecobacter sp.]
MNMAFDAPLLGRMLRPLASRLRPDLIQALATMTADPSDQERYEELAAKNTEGTLSEGERAELESIVNANRILSALKTEAKTALAPA